MQPSSSHHLPQGPLLLIGAVAFCLGACGVDDPSVNQNSTPLTSNMVAAIQYGWGMAKQVKASCASATLPDLCAVDHLVTEAANKGAKFVVTPEEGLGQEYLEEDPKVGALPATDTGWEDTLMRAMSKRAKALKIHLVINLQTYVGNDSFNAAIAFGPDGRVVAVHHKFELFANERNYLVAGKDVTVFSTPAGKVGMMICADLYGDLRLHDKMTRQLGASIVTVSSAWTAKGAPNWPAAFARNWGVYVLSANTTSGPGIGGGVFNPDGQPLDTRVDPGVTVGTITAP